MPNANSFAVSTTLVVGSILNLPKPNVNLSRFLHKSTPNCNNDFKNDHHSDYVCCLNENREQKETVQL